MPTPDPEAIETVLQVLATIAPDTASRARADSTLTGDLAFDLTDRSWLAITLQDALQIRITDAEIMGWDTISDVAETVQHRQQESAAA